ncbi:MAG TPA: TIGR01777 family oxidoreductase, partial [Nocardioides sp.]|nr:TIGR01777 family oxidoreductase [Nocardioides sp.]
VHRLSPPWQPIRVVREAASLRDGEAEFALPAGRRWVARHDPDGYVEGEQFVDELVSRPFVAPVRWRHEHRIEPAAGGSSLTDRVSTTAPRRFVAPMFGYRHRQLAGDLAAHTWARSLRPEPLTVAMTGASGLVGSALSAFLTTGGHRVVRLVRHPVGGPDERRWDPSDPAPELLEGVDAVVHLAGASIAGRFTDEHRAAIRDSRIEPTRRLAALAARAGVTTFVSASAIGLYGADRGDELLTESSERGEGFLADVVADWEAAASAAAADCRVVTVRTGIVQSPAGGALALLRPLYAAGLGGPIAGGSQWQSWIGIDDLLDVYLRALVDTRLSGPVNAVAPTPVTGSAYAKTLGRAVHRPAVLPVPSFGPRLLLGSEGAREVALASQRVQPAVLESLDHPFRFPMLEPALRHVLGSA